MGLINDDVSRLKAQLFVLRIVNTNNIESGETVKIIGNEDGEIVSNEIDGATEQDIKECQAEHTMYDYF